MIPVKDSLVHTDNLPGDEIKFRIGDPRWMMRSAAKLYSDVSTAIIREYSTNAHDANVMANNPDPIQVTLPSMMNPFFTVEDKGVGMNRNDFEEIYTQFGISDKREAADTNGLMGFGSKSGVAYTTQFTVTSIKDGIKIQGVVMRKPDWEIVLKVVATSKTDEPNGTKIVIPVHNVDEFNHKANEFYKFWLPGRVLVNGKEPEHAVGEKIVDGLYFSKGWNTSYVVMGNVAYRINNPSALFRNTKMNQINFVAYVDNGDVEFTPSREDLEYTDHTKSTLQKIVDDFEAQILKTATAEIAVAKTHAEAYTAWIKWTELLGTSLFADLEFKGDKFVSDFDVKGYRYSPSAYRGNGLISIRKWNVEAMPKTVVVTEFDISVSSRHKKMVKEYAKMQGWPFSYGVFTAAKADEVICPWIDKTQFVTYKEMKDALPKEVKPAKDRNYYNPNAGRVKGSWDYFTSTGQSIEKSIPDTADGDLYWISLQAEKSVNVISVLNNIGDTKAVVIKVPGNREEKFLRDNPKVKPFMPYAKTKVVKDGESLLSKDAKRMLAIDSTTRAWVTSLDMNKIKDPALATLASLVSNETGLMAAYQKNLDLARQVGSWYDVKQYKPVEDTSYNIIKKYPLLGSMNRYSVKNNPDLYVYLNAKHLAETE